MQYGFILYQEQTQRNNGGGEESVFFHMNSLTGTSEFSDLRPGDEVEFLMTYSQRTRKHSAIHVKKLRWGIGMQVSMKDVATKVFIGKLPAMGHLGHSLI